MNVKKLFVMVFVYAIIGNYNIWGVKPSNSSNSLTGKSNKHVIGSWGAGFGSCFHAVLNHLDYCEKANKTPVVHWGKESFYYDTGGFNGSYNVWEYYFQPISDLYYKKGDRIDYTYDPNGLFTFHYPNIIQSKRDRAATLIKKYINLNELVLSKINSFYQKNMAGKKTIGIHIRGTDKFLEEKIVKPEEMVKEALKYTDQETQFLIASDEKKLFDQIIGLLPNRKVIYYDCYRSENGKPLHIRSKPSPGKLGEDILIEISLLAQCDLLVHTASNVSSVALYFNHNLPNVLVR